MNYPERYEVSSLKLNDAGRRVVDAEFALGIEPRSGFIVTPFFTLDASGADKGHRDAAGATGRITIWGARASRSSVVFDIDRDGDLDIITNEFNAEPMVLVSNLADRRPVPYVSVRLIGVASNRDGLGAVVKVTGTTQTNLPDA